MPSIQALPTELIQIILDILIQADIEGASNLLQVRR